MPINLGSTEISKAYLGSTAVDKIYLGSTQIWSSFSEQGMIKLGSASGTGKRKILGWSPLNGGSTVVNDALVVTGSHNNVTISARINYTGNVDYSGRYVYVFLNGIEIGSASDDREPVSLALSNQILQNGDVLEVWGNATSGARSGYSADGTYLTITPVTA